MTGSPLPPGRQWIARAPFIAAFDYNIHAHNAAVYGQALDWDYLRRYLREIRPDLVLTQALSYWGWACYRSAMAPSPPGGPGDFVDRFVRLCREEKVRVGFMVLSWQSVPEGRTLPAEQVQRWCRVDATRQRDPLFFCPNSPYAEEFLIPFCREAIERYQPAALWFDHSRTRPCWCEHCRQGFGRELPQPGTPNEWARVELFSDASFIAALEQVGRALHAADPDLVICWANALDHHTQRPPFAEVDWISSDEVNTPHLGLAQFDCTYRSTLGLPGHLWVPDKARFPLPRQRPPEQLCAEAATVAAHGLGLTMYHIPHPTGALGCEMLASAKTAAAFVRKRAGFCLGNQSVPHVALIASHARNLRYPNRFQPNPRDLRIAHALLSQNHVPCEIVNDVLLRSRLSAYDLVILPETQLLAPATAAAIERHVNEGGRVLIIGVPPAVADPTDVHDGVSRLFGLNGALTDRIERHFEQDRLAHLGHMVQTRVTGEVIWWRIEVDGQSREPLLLRVSWGRGHIYWLLCDAISECGGRPSMVSESVEQVMAAFNSGAHQIAASAPAASTRYHGLEQMDYDNRPYREDLVSQAPLFHPHLRRLVGRSVREALGSRWRIRSDAPPGVEFVLNRRGDDLFVHLVNHNACMTAPETHYVTDSIPVLADIAFDLRLDAEARHVVGLPAGTVVQCTQTPDGCHILLPRLHYHAAVLFSGILG